MRELNYLNVAKNCVAASTPKIIYLGKNTMTQSSKMKEYRGRHARTKRCLLDNQVASAVMAVRHSGSASIAVFLLLTLSTPKRNHAQSEKTPSRTKWIVTVTLTKICLVLVVFTTAVYNWNFLCSLYHLRRTPRRPKQGETNCLPQFLARGCRKIASFQGSWLGTVHFLLELSGRPRKATLNICNTTSVNIFEAWM